MAFAFIEVLSPLHLLKSVPILGVLCAMFMTTCFAKSPKVHELYGPEFLLSIKEAELLHEKAEELYTEAHYDKAFQSLKDALQITEKSLGAEHRDVANLLGIMAEGYILAGDYDQALKLLKRSLTIGEAALGKNHPVVARTLRDLSRIYLDKGNLNEGKALLNRCLAIQEKFYGPEHVAVAISLQWRAWIEFTDGNFREAIATINHNSAVIQRALGKENFVYGENLRNAAAIYSVLADYSKAEACAEESLAILERVFAADHLSVAAGFRVLATIYEEQGQYAKAAAFLKRALAITEKKLGSDHIQAAPIFNQMGLLAYKLGFYSGALDYLQKSLAIYEKSMGRESPSVAAVLNEMGWVYNQQGNYDEGMETCKRSLAIVEKVFGTDHVAVAASLSDLASHYRSQKNFKDALPLYQRSLELRQKALGPEHPVVAISMSNLAVNYNDLGNFEEAIRSYGLALDVQLKVLGPEHPDVATTLENLAICLLDYGDYQFSIQCFSAMFRGQRNYLLSELSGLDDDIGAYLIDRSYSRSEIFHSVCAAGALQNLSVAKVDGAEQLAYCKALLEEVRTIQAALETDPDSRIQELREQYLAVRAQIDRVAESNLTPEQRDAKRRELQTALFQIQKELLKRRRFLDRSLHERDLTLADIAHNIPSEAALVDFVQYYRYDFAAKTEKWKEQRYAAYLTFPLARDATNVVVERFDLGEAAPIDETVELICKRMAAGQYRAKDLSPALQRLSDLVYAPLAGHLTNVSHLIVCPDGQLSRVPFELLRDGDKFLVEEKTISYVTSGREVAQLTTESKAARSAAKPALVMGDPDFDLDLGSARVPRAVADASSGQSTGSSRGDEALSSKSGIENRQSKIDQSLLTSAATRSLSFRSLNFKRLHGTADEARTSAKLLGRECALRLGAQARERELKAVRSPRVLHLATHGFFLSDQEFKHTNSLQELSLVDTRSGRRSFVPPKNRWENPMVRCGIALAGANHAQQITNAVAEDGLLTGLEASLLNLQGTELVILSACDTGSGEVKIGEGVMSLRRAFRIAGAESVLASHWNVSDKATGRLMTEFMRRWRSGEPRAKAWREAQLSLLHSKDFPNPYFWAAFTLTGQWK